MGLLVEVTTRGCKVLMAVFNGKLPVPEKMQYKIKHTTKPENF